MLECVVRSFCGVFPLRCGCYVTALYHMVFWVGYLVPGVTPAHCYPRAVDEFSWWSACGAGAFSLPASLALLHGLRRGAPGGSLVVFLCVQHVSSLYCVVLGFVLVVALRLDQPDCPRQDLVAVLHALQAAWHYYGLTCVHSLLLQLEAAPPAPL